jgi:hypothetical protein
VSGRGQLYYSPGANLSGMRTMSWATVTGNKWRLGDCAKLNHDGSSLWQGCRTLNGPGVRVFRYPEPRVVTSRSGSRGNFNQLTSTKPPRLMDPAQCRSMRETHIHKTTLSEPECAAPALAGLPRRRPAPGAPSQAACQCHGPGDLRRSGQTTPPAPGATRGPPPPARRGPSMAIDSTSAT